MMLEQMKKRQGAEGNLHEMKNLMGEYRFAAKKLEQTLEKTRFEMVKVLKGVTTGRKSIVGNMAIANSTQQKVLPLDEKHIVVGLPVQ